MQLNTLVALEFFYKSALAGDRQDWVHEFDIGPTLVHLTKMPEVNNYHQMC